MEFELKSSIALNKELIAQQISQVEHLKGLEMKSKNKKMKTMGKGNRKSPFGDFPKIGYPITSKTGPGPERKPLYEMSYSTKNQKDFGNSTIGMTLCFVFRFFSNL